MIKIFALILLLVVVPVSAEKSAYELSLVTASHTDDTAIEIRVYLNDKDSFEIASDGTVTISILESPSKGPSIVDQPVSSKDGDFVYLPDSRGRTMRVKLAPSSSNDDAIEDNAEPEIFNRTYKVKKSEFETKPYVCWESPEIKYSEFEREPKGDKCWVIASFTTPDGRILKYDGYGGEFIY